MPIRHVGHVALLATLSLCLTGAETPDPNRPIAASMAIGLNGIVPYGEAWQFADMMKYSREWRSRVDNKAWTVVEDPQGWPKSLVNKDGTTAEISPAHPIFMYFYGRRVEGPVTLTWEGDGEVTVAGKGFAVTEDGFPAAKRRVIAWDYRNGSPTIEVRRSNPADHVRNIRLWMPGMADGTRTFHPAWTEILKPFPYFRFMDWGATNGSTVVEWADRSTPDRMRQSGGVAWEYMIQLANEMGKDMWICLPHRASDDYVRQLGRLLKTTLRPDLRIYVEYSNEIWNPAFSHTKWLWDQAKAEIAAKGLTGKNGKPLAPWEYGSVLCGRRSAQIWKILSTELGAPDRLVRTITHFRWLELAMAAALDPANGEGRVDLIGLNGYFINHHAFDYVQRDAAQWNRNEAMDLLEQLVLLEDAPSWADEMGKVRAQWPTIPITCYEGGQHFANPFAARSQGDGIAKLMYEVNGDPRIRGIYRAALESWHLAGGTGFTAFVDCGSWSKYGCWGHKEYVTQPLEDRLGPDGAVIERGAHKFAALMDYIERNRHRRTGGSLAITTAELPESQPGQPYQATLSATGGTPPYRWSVLGGRLPAGLRLAADGTISGTPTASEQLALLIDCTDAAGTPIARSLSLFMAPVTDNAWQQVTADQLTKIHNIPAWPASAQAAHGYAVRATLSAPAKANEHALNGIALHLTPDGDQDDYLRIGLRGGGTSLIACSRYVKDSKNELWGERRFAIIPDAGEPDSTTAWDAGEAWTLTAVARPGAGLGAIDLLLELRDEAGKPRLVGGRPDVANGRVLMRELALKDALRSGPWGILLNGATLGSVHWAPVAPPAP